MELRQDDIDGKVTTLLAKSTATEEALQELKSMLRSYIGNTKDV
jgi:chaperonin cofactor prefoldin